MPAPRPKPSCRPSDRVWRSPQICRPRDGCRGLASAVAERWDSLDVLINNAGATWGAPLADHDERAWEKVLSVNVKGVAHLTRFLVPLLQVSGTADSPSRIINVGSING
jgi:NAD(P)-dependent dehydrogenase (short-subunit alcohol dehydrogenase family)